VAGPVAVLWKSGPLGRIGVGGNSGPEEKALSGSGC
jgi:hypothetical protein